MGTWARAGRTESAAGTHRGVEPATWQGLTWPPGRLFQRSGRRHANLMRDHSKIRVLVGLLLAVLISWSTTQATATTVPGPEGPPGELMGLTARMARMARPAPLALPDQPALRGCQPERWRSLPAAPVPKVGPSSGRSKWEVLPSMAAQSFAVSGIRQSLATTTRCRAVWSRGRGGGRRANGWLQRLHPTSLFDDQRCRSNNALSRFAYRFCTRTTCHTPPMPSPVTSPGSVSLT